MKKIHQTYISDDKSPYSEYISSKVNKLKELYHDYEYTLYDNDMCRDEIKSLLGNRAATAYDSLASYSFRSDFARYCILYNRGGYYFDLSICPEFKFEFSDTPVLFKSPNNSVERFNNTIDNGVMYFNKINHSFLHNAIALTYRNVVNKQYGEHVLDITGPVMLSRLKTYDVKFGEARWIEPMKQKGAYYNDELHWLYKPEGNSFHSLQKGGTNSYESMWFDRKIYYEN